MTPRHLILSGFSGIASGMGRDELILDLEKLSGNAKTITIVAPNGTGKTTILDNMHPYRIMPSRATANSPGSFSFYDHLSRSEARKELHWEHKGHQYQSILLFKVTDKTKKQDAFLHIKKGESWEPYVMPDGTVSDGKTDTYDRCIESILGSPETFFTSVFSAQTKRPLSSYSNGEIKSLMADLLGLEKIRELGAKAADVCKKLKSRLEELRPDNAKAESLKLQLDAVTQTLNAHRASHVQLVESGAQLVSQVEKMQIELATARARQDSEQEKVQRRAMILERIDVEKNRFAKELAIFHEDMNSVRQKIRNLNESLVKVTADTEKSLAAFNSSLVAAEKIISRKEEMMTAKVTLAELDTLDAVLMQNLNSVQLEIESYHKDMVQIETLISQKIGIEREGKVLVEQRESYRKRASLISEVPCNGTSFPATCPLLKDAMLAKESMPLAEKAVVDHRIEWEKVNKQIIVLKAQTADNPCEAKKKEIETQLESTRRRIRELQSVTALEASLHAAEKTISSVKEQITHQKMMGDSQTAMLKESIEKEVAEEQKLLSRQDSGTHASQQAIASLEQELATIPFYAGIDEVKKAENELEQAAKVSREHSVKISELEAVIAELETSSVRIATESQILESSLNKIHRIEEEIPYWILLSKAFGNDGIVALSIDDAGPTLACIVNDLLLKCYGPRFTVSIQTQMQTAKGEMKEGFDILVHDADRNEAKSITVMSGGQKVWINETLTRAIALYIAYNSGNEYKTLFSDEADGPLDPERKKQFMSMKKRVLEIGNYDREYFVTQTPDLWNEADVIINLDELNHVE
ncbi:MAG: hypothetical protein KGI54_05795 [Pseudomonadota bacterium]|nr:hypothetical protein [Pseudomonadota bacterium]